MQAPDVTASPVCSEYPWLYARLQALSLRHYRRAGTAQALVLALASSQDSSEKQEWL
ncbi:MULTISPECIES: hypothetical protein [unclassified Psychrobacter]|uniref:hypothetical protein n=1 Tax=unclassified Psychrobacter TaxID=196806 RepID=UPI0012E3E501|nr:MULTISPECIES: hypothetical protein [unclassified Psychrobacter]